MTINNMTPLEEAIDKLITTSLIDLGYSVVRVKVIKGNTDTLQIMLDRVDDEAITLQDCTKASRFLSAMLDVEDPMPGEYNLEVSSPGLDRPLMRLKDFEKFKGSEAKISVSAPVNNKKNLRGHLLGVSGDKIRLKQNDEIVEVDFAVISSAKLVLNQELLANHEANEISEEQI